MELGILSLSDLQIDPNTGEPGGLPRPMAEDSIHRFATDIAPAVRASTTVTTPS